MKKKEMKIIQICPNCGHRVKASDFFNKNLMWGGQPPGGGNITCPKCGYNGLPVEVEEHDLSKIKFVNKPMDRPVFIKMNWISYLMLLGALGWVLLLFEHAYPFGMALVDSILILVGFAPLIAVLLVIVWIIMKLFEKK